MKLEKITHDHLLTKWLKVIIFALLMLAPIFSVASRCLYVICNKNAYQSYSNSNIVQKTTQVAQTGNLQDGFLYNAILNYDVGNANILSSHYDYSQINISWEDYGAPSGYNYDSFAIFSTGNNNNYYIYLYEGTSNPYVFWYAKTVFGTNLNFSFTARGSYSQNGNQILNLYTNTFQLEKLDNVFDYSVSQLKQDQLFNWTQNTGVYTGVNAMTTGLGMTDGTIAILLTYWMLLTIIYVIIDIVLAGFTMLTHMIYNKKAE